MEVKYNDYEVELYKLRRLSKEIMEALGSGNDGHLKALGNTLEVISDILTVLDNKTLLRAANKLNNND